LTGEDSKSKVNKETEPNDLASDSSSVYDLTGITTSQKGKKMNFREAWMTSEIFNMK